MPIILGIDPGSIKTGYGLVHQDGRSISHIAHGHIKAKGKTVPERLHHIHQTILEIIQTHNPDEAAIEQVFVQHNVQSALKLGQARGAALVAMAHYGLSIAEYAPREIKKTATGYGAATKSQIQFMMRSQLRLTTQPQEDAADALAIAVCHCQHRAFLAKVQQTT